MGPVGWLFSVLLLWIVALPAYLAVRPRLSEAAGVPAAGGAPQGAHQGIAAASRRPPAGSVTVTSPDGPPPAAR